MMPSSHLYVRRGSPASRSRFCSAHFASSARHSAFTSSGSSGSGSTLHDSRCVWTIRTGPAPPASSSFRIDAIVKMPGAPVTTAVPRTRSTAVPGSSGSAKPLWAGSCASGTCSSPKSCRRASKYWVLPRLDVFSSCSSGSARVACATARQSTSRGPPGAAASSASSASGASGASGASCATGSRATCTSSSCSETTSATDSRSFPVMWYRGNSSTSKMGIPSGILAFNCVLMSSTSMCLVSTISRISLSEVHPRGKVSALVTRGRALNSEPVTEMGSAARRYARSMSRSVSRCPTHAMDPSFANLMRTFWVLAMSFSHVPSNAGSGGGSTTTLSPKSSPHTPHSLHTWCEQSGTVTASIARCRSDFSQNLETPVLMWSQGRGRSRRSSCSTPRSMRPLPCPPCPRYRSSPSFSSTSHSPSSTCRYFHVSPESSMALSHDANASSVPSHHASFWAPFSQALSITAHSLRSPRPMKSSIALIRNGV
mmetsp:Transcript_18436/g.29317  ORF Transcript_18436/g.29317 Transcript_18436/m.29317 type:complete len:484 (-) Transcript_18436:1789-3240(-)